MGGGFVGRDSHAEKRGTDSGARVHHERRKEESTAARKNRSDVHRKRKKEICERKKGKPNLSSHLLQSSRPHLLFDSVYASNPSISYPIFNVSYHILVYRPLGAQHVVL